MKVLDSYVIFKLEKKEKKKSVASLSAVRQACLSQTLLLFSCLHFRNDLLRLLSCKKPLSGLLFLRRCLTCRPERKSARAGGGGWHVISDQGKYGHASMIYCVRACVRALGITCTFSASLVTTAVVSQRKTSACKEQQNVAWKVATSFYVNLFMFSVSPLFTACSCRFYFYLHADDAFFQTFACLRGNENWAAQLWGVTTSLEEF